MIVINLVSVFAHINYLLSLHLYMSKDPIIFGYYKVFFIINKSFNTVKSCFYDSKSVILIGYILFQL
jgi:hypothetical protein